ncbi:vWA domain-containing protein [Amycolatopsis alkalitolerans]|uniref:VWA domain-containing protein n=1 Tax=Amycolatopsis alkalitolerans TaxID=2547244 RepID=A0A5C4LSB3_9PSEU|nr:VWA domain-containing protein [Amycolatopsis alkalitolerans]TNC21180.1 VWA domain-containing protein [Amycolatopsis alkalitolerans]
MVHSADPLPALVGFATALREAGLPAGPQRVHTYLEAVQSVDLADINNLYWAGRVTLCADPDDLPRYDDAFAQWFAAEPPGPKPVTVAKEKKARMAAMSGEPAGDGQGEQEADELRVAASDTELLRQRDLAELTAAERRHLRELLATLKPQPPVRKSQRQRPAKKGDLDPDRTLRAMLAGGGEPVKLARRKKTTRPRRIVLLVDVSGSMSPYADSLLRFAHVLVRNAPQTEVFTLGTRLTRVSRQLRQRDPERAMLGAGEAVPDFAGGTRLGETLRVFLDRWGQRGLARRAVVVVFSDGWERGDPALLGEQLARMRRLAHSVLWVNPHAGRDGYAPVQSGIAAALPHLDHLLAGHSLATLERLLVEIRDA